MAEERGLDLLTEDLFRAALESGYRRLQAHKDAVNRLNVFPVPDGDTGTNMVLTLGAGLEESRGISGGVGAVAQAFARGLLMGARGNSGVIVSQLFRGFAQEVDGKPTLTPLEWAEAVDAGVRAAYRAVMKPAEGTILTVSRKGAQAALGEARRGGDFVSVVEALLRAARETLARTPEMLEPLRQAGVVDAGGQGYVFFYEGFLEGLRGEGGSVASREEAVQGTSGANRAALVEALEEGLPDDVHAWEGDPEDLPYGFCTNFVVRLYDPASFREDEFRRALERFGDSIVVLRGDDLVRAHVHSETPGEVLTWAQSFGELVRIKIDNMREQIRAQKARSEARRGTPGAGGRGSPSAPAAETEAPPNPAEGGTGAAAKENPASIPRVRTAVVAVVQGKGFAALMESLGVQALVDGGETMNPSTEAILTAIRSTNADAVVVLPNNGNVVLAAEQARQLADRPVFVVPTSTLPEGVSALVAYRPDLPAEENVAAMEEALRATRVAQITRAVRDARFDGESIRAGDYIALSGKSLLAKGNALEEVLLAALERLEVHPGGMLTLFWGDGLSEDTREGLLRILEERYPNLEIEAFEGGQPLYPLLVSFEG
ncbi:MAG: DAK2 domain-containing protein [Brockia lithotrophica]|nr:DAK2 domain-containing protein [Brockia lithotrophica]